MTRQTAPSLLHSCARTAPLSLTALLAALALAAWAPDASAQEARKYMVVDTVHVSDVEPSLHILRVRDPVDEEKTQSFVIDDATVIERDGEPIELGALQPGSRIAVSAREPVGVEEPVEHPLIAEKIVVVNVASGEATSDQPTSGEPTPQ